MTENLPTGQQNPLEAINESRQDDAVPVDSTKDAPGVEEVEILDRLGPAIRESVERSIHLAVSHESHSGPMPPPKQFALYDAALPGTAKVIRDEFQANSLHIRTMESRALGAHKDDNDKNRSAAERLVWGALIAAVVLALTGHDWVAVVIVGTTVALILANFLNRGRRAKQDSSGDNVRSQSTGRVDDTDNSLSDTTSQADNTDQVGEDEDKRLAAK
ncbi:hypothetical protein FMZ60_08605 [Alcaligenaceae bacterium SJ-26]|nr:hypothetical protein FMZ60_08605 [Alcaligenaceae bacterium SJ-26]